MGAVTHVPDIFEEQIEQLTTIATSGTVKKLVRPESMDDLVPILKFAGEENLKTVVLGKGSNVLIKDVNSSLFVDLSKLDKFDVKGDVVTAQCGVNLGTLISITMGKELSGLETLWGIPASVGGACFMNAGGKFGETFDNLQWVEVLKDLKVIRYMKHELGYSYRNGGVPTGAVVLRASFKLKQASKQLISERFEEVKKHKVSTQPLNEKSAGCIFKNVNLISASQLIDNAGLKGTKVGGAEVSARHANFIVNKGGATSDDVLKLMEIIKNSVYKKFRVELREEILILS